MTATDPSPEELTPLGRMRRDLLALISLGAGGIASLLFAAPVIGFLFSPLTKATPGRWQTVGKLDDFEIGKTGEVTLKDISAEKWGGPANTAAVWLRRDDQNAFTAFAVDCTHLGCPVRWIASAELFMCPCHGGVYYKDGAVAAGPPPHALQQYPSRVRDGLVQIEWVPLPNVARKRNCRDLVNIDV
ncbi:MAG: Rieske (2Fe-2S) protein [Acidobacteriaceae bacterium]